MTDTNDLLNYENSNEPKISSTLNVLTILSFIGCGIMLLVSVFTPMIMNFSKKMMHDSLNSGQLSDKQIADIQKAMPGIEVMSQNMVPLMIVGIIGVVLCFIGALWMRRLKKDGFWIYIAGQIVPIIGGVILLGKYQFPDAKSYVWLLIPIVFIILYAGQRKYLVK